MQANFLNHIRIYGFVISESFTVIEYKSKYNSNEKAIKFTINNIQNGNPNFIEIAVWDPVVVDYVLNNIKRRDLVEITGKLLVNSYTKDDKKYYKTYIKANRVLLSKMSKYHFETSIQ
ncbi:single-stranded DNA-binding protein [Mycoplasmopsis agalactiae]|nr:single-stranded DNA-binding protein [Mycoplasmopsis agalactiae]MCE6090520.1 single-stranded DNA-binding protein [Mycoplasmopsis agalactiae]MCE6090688.1 single-stranded DNA-binding protein [Mycoplasmopsis agalactiae]MCE6090779.1 single-stranded DNA-binding protein [Mycoplasmopsis agalactiae]